MDNRRNKSRNRTSSHARAKAREARRSRQQRKPAGRRPPGGVAPRGRARVQAYRQGAQNRLRRFRQGSALAVGITALILLVWMGDQTAAAQDNEEAPMEEMEGLPTDPTVSLEQATETIRDLLLGFYAMLPRLVIALVLIALAVFVAKGFRYLLERYLGRWERTSALAALAQIGILLLAIAAALSVLAGDARALLGSIGLVGLALSWALQTPIESFTGWLMNSFRGYYRVGDRIEVGEVFGDVFKIDVLTTTVWEAGGPEKPVAGAQSTGAMITFPNWEVLRSNIINYSRDFPYVWDEVTYSVANESDLPYTIEVLERVARNLFGDKMTAPAHDYRTLLQQARLAFDIEEDPKAFLSIMDAWTDCTVRYLVPARARRRWASDLTLALSLEVTKPEHHGRIIPAYPRQEIHLRNSWTEKQEK